MTGLIVAVVLIALSNVLMIFKISNLENGDMDEIASSIERDHKDLVDIRERYILWREPQETGAGVPWAKDYKCKEDE